MEIIPQTGKLWTVALEKPTGAIAGPLPIPPSPHPQASAWDCSTEQQQNLDRIHLTIIQVILGHPGTVMGG